MLQVVQDEYVSNGLDPQCVGLDDPSVLQVVQDEYAKYQGMA